MKRKTELDIKSSLWWTLLWYTPSRLIFFYLSSCPLGIFYRLTSSRARFCVPSGPVSSAVRFTANRQSQSLYRVAQKKKCTTKSSVLIAILFKSEHKVCHAKPSQYSRHHKHFKDTKVISYRVAGQKSQIKLQINY